MKKAFTLVEILIVVAILGILAAAVLPSFRGHIIEAKEATAKDMLRVLRNAIELYASQHNNVPPGYMYGNTSSRPSFNSFLTQMVTSATNASGRAGGSTSSAAYPFGPYLSALPENPFNNSTYITLIGNNEQFPAEPTGTVGWLYKPATKTIRLNWPGTDKDGIRYFDY